MYQMIMPILMTFVVITCSGHPNHPRMICYPFSFVSREAWGACPAKGTLTPLQTPVPYVVIHHTYIPDICLTKLDCIQDMRDIQSLHQIDNGWFDIGYNFVVGGEGSVFEGRGWEAVGAHAAGSNSVSIGIAIIGDYREVPPPSVALESTKLLILEGVRRGIIKGDYKLVGHRQMTTTECPGEGLFQEIQNWAHFSETTNKTSDHY